MDKGTARCSRSPKKPHLRRPHDPGALRRPLPGAPGRTVPDLFARLIGDKAHKAASMEVYQSEQHVAAATAMRVSLIKTRSRSLEEWYGEPMDWPRVSPEHVAVVGAFI